MPTLDDTLCAAFAASVERHPDRLALRAERGDVSWSWGEYDQRVREVAAGLHALGLRRGDRLALFLPNCLEFYVLDTAAQAIGAVPVSYYQTIAANQVTDLVANSEPRFLFCDLEREPVVADASLGDTQVFVLDPDRDSLGEIVAAGATFDFDGEAAKAEPTDLITIIYTSGTTGPPKGVEITHRTAIASALAMNDAVGYPDPTRVLSYLPTAHVAERTISLWFAACFGFTATICPDPRSLADYLPDARPHWFFGVPRIYEKLRAAILAAASAEETAAIEASLARVRAGERPLDDASLAAVRRRIGLDEIVGLNCGGAPLMIEVIHFYAAIGVPLGELWGMSETTGTGAINRVGAIRPGTCGPAAKDVQLRTDPETNELLARGPSVSPGYFRRPDLTAEARTEDGWLRTGDLARIDDEGYLHLIGRSKEIIINSAGKNMSPTNIEAEVKGASMLVGQVMVVGDAKPYNTALIVLDPDAAAEFARRRGLTAEGIAALARNPEVEAEIAAAVTRANERLSRVEGIKTHTVLEAEWSPDGDEMTPTMKLKRPAILAKYGTEIDAMYAAPRPAAG